MAWVRFRKKEMPGGLWTKCPSCGEMVFTKELLENFKICKKCAFHMTCTVDERISFTCDEGTFEELYADLEPVDRLGFVDKGRYSDKLKETAAKVGRKEAMAVGTGRVAGREVVLGVMNFQFLGGSMGVVVGEKVTLAVETAMERELPLLLVCASGGARMHEGALSLMQMAKTCAALGRFADAGGLSISVLTNPTTGGVTASFATMADVVIGEPGALIGFAGPRVIQNTIKQELPEGFQRSEFLLARGQIDRIVPRDELPRVLFRLMEYLRPADPSTLRLPQGTAAAKAPDGERRNGGAKGTSAEPGQAGVPSKPFDMAAHAREAGAAEGAAAPRHGNPPTAALPPGPGAVRRREESPYGAVDFDPASRLPPDVEPADDVDVGESPGGDMGADGRAAKEGKESRSERKKKRKQGR